MRRLFSVAMICTLALISLLAIGPVHAGSASYSGALATTDPTFNRPLESGAGLSGLITYYDEQTFSVDVSGLYTMEMIAGAFSPGVADDGFFVLYVDFVTSADPLLNWYNSDDAGGAGDLPRLVEYLDAGVNYTLVSTTFDTGVTGSYSVQITGPGNVTLGRRGNPNTFGDGRINNSVILDGGAPVAIYCRSDGAVDVYFISRSSQRGTFLFRVSAQRISDIGVPTEANTLLRFVGSVAVYRLTTGEFQVNAVNFDGTPYAVVWNGCPATRYYHPENH
ncbi:MAG: hypothetical protein U0694_03755 [Anaerolineae bacterium]